MFEVHDRLDEAEIDRGLAAVTRDGMASQAMMSFTSGAFLVAFALQLGASNAVIGLLAAISPLTQLIQVPAIWLVERVQNRKAVTMVSVVAARMFLPFIAAIPFLFDGDAAIQVLLGAFLVRWSLGAIAGCSWNSWMKDLIPPGRLGTFSSRRLALATGLGIVLSLGAALFLDQWKTWYPHREIQGYSVLFIVGFLAGMLGVYFISQIPEPRMVPAAEGLGRLLLKPFRDTNFRRLIIFLASWAFAVNLAAPFFTVYMLKQLGMPMSEVIGLTILSQIFNVLFLQIWGRFTDRFSNKSVLAVSGPLFIVCILAFTFTTMPDKHVFTYPLLIAIHVLMGISTAGVALATGNIDMKMAPKGMATAYVAASRMVNSLAAGIAPILGGQFADWFAERKLTWTLHWVGPEGEKTFETLSFEHWDFFFGLAFILGLYSLHRLSLVTEEGEVEEGVVVNQLIAETRLQLKTLSTAGGLHHLFVVPIGQLLIRPGAPLPASSSQTPSPLGGAGGGDPLGPPPTKPDLQPGDKEDTPLS